MAKWSDVAGVVGKLAPTIAAAVGGPLAGSAVTAITNAFGLNKSSGDVSAQLDSAAAVIAGATPEQLLALKKADQEYAEKLGQLDLDAQSLAAQDRANARSREVALKDWTPRILAYLVVGGFVGMAYGVLFHKMSADSALAGAVIGYLSAKAEMVANYYWGSSASADRKTELLAKAPAVKD